MPEAEGSDKSIPYFFPDECPVRFTLQVFPHSGLLSAGLATRTPPEAPFFDVLPLPGCLGKSCGAIPPPGQVHEKTRSFLLVMHEVLVEESQDNSFLVQRSGSNCTATVLAPKAAGWCSFFLPYSFFIVGAVRTAAVCRTRIK